MTSYRRAGIWVLTATIIGSSIAFIDSTVVNIALPALQADLNADVFDVQWIVEIYVLFMAALMLAGGALGDRYGRRRVYAIGIGLFAVASLGCGLAQTVSQLILARALQGVGGALLVPGSLAIINAYFDATERGQAIGTWSGFSALTTALGPVIGGLLIEHASWRWVFFINIPLAVTVLVILFQKVPESRNEHAPDTLDGWGALLATVSLGGLTFGLIEAGNSGYNHPLVLVSLGIGLAALGIFFIVEARSSNPMLPLPLFKSRPFSGANLLTFLLYAGLGGLFFFMPFNLIQVQGYSATLAGAALLPFVLMLFLLSRWAGGLADRMGNRKPMVAGTVIAALGFLLFAVPGVGSSYWLTFLPATVVLGLGMAICIPALSAAALGAVEIRYSGTASGVNNAISRVAGLLAIAIFGLLMLAAFNWSLNTRMQSMNISPEIRHSLDAERVKLAGAQISATIGEPLRTQLKAAIHMAFVTGFRLIMLISAILSLLSALVAEVMIKDRPKVLK
jgi:EmrB/QacA subfamily drug resistance transporter